MAFHRGTGTPQETFEIKKEISGMNLFSDYPSGATVLP